MNKRMKIALSALIGIAFLLYIAHQYNVDRARVVASQYNLGDYLVTRRLDTFQKKGNIISVEWSVESDGLEDQAITKVIKDKEAYEGLSFGKKYLVRQNIRIRKEGLLSIGVKRESDEYWTLDIYSLDSLDQKPKSFDILKDVETAEYTVLSVPQAIFLDGDGKEFILINLYSKQRDRYYRLLDLESGSLSDIHPIDITSDTIPGYSYYPIGLTGVVNGTNLEEKFAEEGLHIVSFGRILYPNGKQLKSQYFKELFSETRQTLSEDDQVYIVAETVSELLEFYEQFYESDEDLYKNLIIDAEYSIDGQTHTVQTKEGFLRYFKQSEEDSE